jgi:hypothetical protein
VLFSFVFGVWVVVVYFSVIFGRRVTCCTLAFFWPFLLNILHARLLHGSKKNCQVKRLDIGRVARQETNLRYDALGEDIKSQQEGIDTTQ